MPVGSFGIRFPDSSKTQRGLWRVFTIVCNHFSSFNSILPVSSTMKFPCTACKTRQLDTIPAKQVDHPGLGRDKKSVVCRFNAPVAMYYISARVVLF
jgi:hypothetical protein